MSARTRRRSALDTFADHSKQSIKTIWYPFQRGLRVSFRLKGDESPDAVMTFTSASRYGGWVDRLKGIVSVYELCRQTNRKFRLVTDESFPIGDFLLPASIDWRMNADEASWNLLESAFHVSRDRRSANFPQLRQSSARRLFVDTNLDYLDELRPDLTDEGRQQLWAARYEELFATTPEFEGEVASHLPASAVAVHARFTSLLGDFTDVTSVTLGHESKRELLRQCLDTLADLAASHRANVVIVFSDSETFLKEARAVGSNIMVVPGDPTHLDHSSEPRKTLHKTLLDFYVMQRCQRIVQLRIGPMYNSAFSRYASYIGRVPFGEITR